ncbi:10315_t:CDS:2 [Paraglomus brasilianum]|uniref:10315_t:CDS:1 n=1 Tax=Paraglomus brasilianum TaxID=144538 RepID=A0A9N9GHT1_9GLOM|nr:10315_t:CDS:2 [Paraglomus brasilianum]
MSEDLVKILLNDMSELYELSEDSDTLIIVGEIPNVREFKAHSLILKSRCSYFHAALSSTWAKKEGGQFTFKKPNMKPEVFEKILRYLYTATLALNDYTCPDLIELLLASDELGIVSLINYLQNYMLTHHVAYIQQNFIRFYHLTSSHLSFNKLREYCQKIILKKPEIAFDAHDFTNIEESLLISLLKRDDLDMEEPDIWSKVIDWVTTKYPDLPENIADWPQADVEEIKKTLNGIIPLIRFGEFPLPTFFYKVCLFDKIIPRGYYIELLENHFVHGHKPHIRPSPPRMRTQIKSVLINKKQANWILAHIQELLSDEALSNDDLYTMTLLGRGSEVGFTGTAFHALADNMGPTVVVMKVSNSDEIIGGYNPLAWQTTTDWSWHKTSKSFLFSFKGKTLNEAAYSKVVEPEEAILYISDRGPIFGKGSDLIVGKQAKDFRDPNSCCIKLDSYQCAIRENGSFAIEEYEVFKVIGKDQNDTSDSTVTKEQAQ